MRGLALLMMVALAACVDSGAAQHPSMTVVEQCSAESGFTARAAAEHAKGVQGDIPGTPKELATINACVKAKASGQVSAAPKPVATPAAKPAASAAMPAPAGHRVCRNTMVGGDSYACMPI